MAKAKDLTGMRFGRLTVIERGEKPTLKSKGAYWICKCDCGNITKPIRSDALKDGNIQSCGCLRKEMTKEMWQDEEYRQMKSDKMRELVKELWQDEDFKQMKSNRTKKQWEDEGFRQMMCEKTKEQWKDEEFKQMQINKMREMWQDEEFKQTQIDRLREINWKGGITPILRYLRNLNNEWYNKCKQEANYTCQLTGKHGVSLHTHHLYAFSLIVMDAHNTHNIEIKEQVKDYTEEELKLLEEYVADWHKDSSNAVVLSEEAHRLFHSLYGKGDNTKEQFEEFKKRFLNGEFDDLLGDVLTVVNKL